MRQVPSGGGQGTLLYLLADHLGSATAVTDSTGAVVSTQKYWPYGTPRLQTGTLPTDKQFTAQQVEPGDSALGLYNYKARFYSTVVGRFVSADPVAVDGLNRYAYGKNNPVRYTDASGHCVGGPDAKCTPQIALDLLACAQSVEGCATVFAALGRDGGVGDFAAAHAFASAAVTTDEFWGNFFRRDINPYFNGDTLAGAYRARLDPVWLFSYANRTFDAYFPSTGSQRFDAAVDWLTDPQQLLSGTAFGGAWLARTTCWSSETGAGAVACGVGLAVWGGSVLLKAYLANNEGADSTDIILTVVGSSYAAQIFKNPLILGILGLVPGWVVKPIYDYCGDHNGCF